jgi:hypothetical protein
MKTLKNRRKTGPCMGVPNLQLMICFMGMIVYFQCDLIFGQQIPLMSGAPNCYTGSAGYQVSNYAQAGSDAFAAQSGIVCPPDQTLVIACCSGTVPLPDYVSLATATCNCAVPAITQAPPAGTLVSAGVHQVTLSISGGSCNPVSCSFNVIVTCIPIAAGTTSADQTIDYNTQPQCLNAGPASGGSGNYGYQWQVYDDVLVMFVDIPGATGMQYCPGALTQTTVYRQCQADLTCGDIVYTNVVTVFVTANAKTINLTIILEGLYDTGTTLLNKAQDCTDGISTFDKFTGTIADTLSIYLAMPADPWAFAFKSFGNAVYTDGTISVTVPGSYSGSYYIVIRHRFSVETWSSVPVPFNAPVINYDFTTGASLAFGNNQKSLDDESSVYGIYSGDCSSSTGNQEGYIDIFDNNDVFNFSQTGAYGYMAEDLTGDGFADIFDMAIVFNNMQVGVGMITPLYPGKK